MIFVAAVTGYLIGSLPTAVILARLQGIDLRNEGSGNPGTNNALRTGGILLAASVLITEATKGYAAVSIGFVVADGAGAIVAAVSAVAGNVFNLWYRFSGGKGLGISLGALAAAWPWVLPVVLSAMIVTVVITRSAGLAALASLAVLVVAAFTWPEQNWSSGGLAATGHGMAVLAIGLTTIMGWKHWRDSPLNPAWRSERRTPA